MSTYFITGGTGTIGQFLTKRILEDGDEVVVFSRDEFKQSEMSKEFPEAKYILGDVREYESIRFAIEQSHPDFVIHTAALKQIGAGEENPLEVVNTNINGTINVLKAAYYGFARRTVVISSDKACYPINLYGATKMIAEKVARQFNTLFGNTIRVVRYGNVAGSRGSVIPAFRKTQLEGKSCNITDPFMTRFWITQNEAVDLIKKALGSEKFLTVPHLPSFRIIDLVKAMCISEIKYSGIRPGEKLHETLLLREENNGEEYTSENNPWKLSVEDLIKKLEEEGL